MQAILFGKTLCLRGKKSATGHRPALLYSTWPSLQPCALESAGTPESGAIQLYAGKQEQTDPTSENYIKKLILQLGAPECVWKHDVWAGVVTFDHVRSDERKIILQGKSVD